MVRIVHGTVVVPGAAAGEALASSEPLSFWGGYDHRSGEIIDRRHPLSGCSAAGRVLAIPATRGSSTSTAVLLEAMRAGTAPAAVLTIGVDSFFALASIVAEEMEWRPIPLIALQEPEFASLRSGQWVQVRVDGTLLVQDRPPEL